MKVGDKVEIFSFKSNKLLKGTIALVDSAKDLISVHTKTIMYDFNLLCLHKKSNPTNPSYIIYTINGINPILVSYDYANAKIAADYILSAQSNGVRLSTPSSTKEPTKVNPAISIKAGVCTCPIRELLMRGCNCSNGRASLERERNKSY